MRLNAARLKISARFFIGVLQGFKPRVVRPLSRLSAAVVLYTDAEWSERKQPLEVPPEY